MPQASFNHAKHQVDPHTEQPLDCNVCHHALQSRETSDALIAHEGELRHVPQPTRQDCGSVHHLPHLPCAVSCADHSCNRGEQAPHFVETNTSRRSLGKNRARRPRSAALRPTQTQLEAWMPCSRSLSELSVGHRPLNVLLSWILRTKLLTNSAIACLRSGNRTARHGFPGPAAKESVFPNRLIASCPHCV